MSNINELKDDVVIVIKERIAGPLGYILLSFIAYNWSWFYFLIFSTKSAESKIKTVTDGFDVASGVGWPFLTGILLAILTPFIKVIMIHVTAFARQLEDKKNYQIKNYLEQYIEETKLELTKKKQEITTRTSKITDLIAQKEALDNEIKTSNDILEKNRDEDRKLHDNMIKNKGEIHSFQNAIAEYRLTQETISNLRSRLHNKSREYSMLRRRLVTFKNESQKLKTFFLNENNIFLISNDENLMEFKEATDSIYEKITGFDAEYFRVINFEFKKENTEVLVTSLKLIDWISINELLVLNSIPSNGYTPEDDDSVVFHFKSELTNEQKDKLRSVITQYIENH